MPTGYGKSFILLLFATTLTTVKVCEGQHSQKLVEKSHNAVTLTDGRLVRVIMEIFALSLQKLVSFVQSDPVSFVYKKALKTDIILQAHFKDLLWRVFNPVWMNK